MVLTMPRQKKQTLICPKCGKPADKMQERNTIVEFFHLGCTIRHVVNKSDMPEYQQTDQQPRE